MEYEKNEQLNSAQSKVFDIIGEIKRQQFVSYKEKVREILNTFDLEYELESEEEAEALLVGSVVYCYGIDSFSTKIALVSLGVYPGLDKSRTLTERREYIGSYYHRTVEYVRKAEDKIFVHILILLEKEAGLLRSKCDVNPRKKVLKNIQETIKKYEIIRYSGYDIPIPRLDLNYIFDINFELNFNTKNDISHNYSHSSKETNFYIEKLHNDFTKGKRISYCGDLYSANSNHVKESFILKYANEYSNIYENLIVRYQDNYPNYKLDVNDDIVEGNKEFVSVKFGTNWQYFDELLEGEEDNSRKECIFYTFISNGEEGAELAKEQIFKLTKRYFVAVICDEEIWDCIY